MLDWGASRGHFSPMRRPPSSSLPQVGRAPEALGAATVMKPELSRLYGSLYVRVAAFAIDVDRIREATDSPVEPWPFGWEVFLTEYYLLATLEIETAGHHALVQDLVAGVLAGPREALGSQIAFSVWNAIERGEWPTSLRSAFGRWKRAGRPQRRWVKELQVFWNDADHWAASLAANCLRVQLEPPCSPPAQDALELLAEPYGDELTD